MVSYFSFDTSSKTTHIGYRLWAIKSAIEFTSMVIGEPREDQSPVENDVKILKKVRVASYSYISIVT